MPSRESITCKAQDGNGIFKNQRNWVGLYQKGAEGMAGRDLEK